MDQFVKYRMGFVACMVLFLISFTFPASAQQPEGSSFSCERSLKEAEALTSMEKYSEAVRLFEQIIAYPSCPVDLKCDAYFGRGKVKEKSKDLNGAIADYDKALQCRPQSYSFRTTLANAYLERGSFRERLGDLRGGPVDYEKALQYNPDLPEARVNLSRIYHAWGAEKEKRGDLNRALEDYKKALRYNPQNSDAAEAMANLKEKQRHKSQQRDALFTF